MNSIYSLTSLLNFSFCTWMWWFYDYVYRLFHFITGISTASGIRKGQKQRKRFTIFQRRENKIFNGEITQQKCNFVLHIVLLEVRWNILLFHGYRNQKRESPYFEYIWSTGQGCMNNNSLLLHGLVVACSRFLRMLLRGVPSDLADCNRKQPWVFLKDPFLIHANVIISDIFLFYHLY